MHLHCGILWVASSKCLIRKLSGLRFFFCFFQRTHSFCPGSRMTYALPLELYGFMVLETIYTSPSYLMALLGGDPSWDWISVRWYSRARYPSGAHLRALALERSCGTRQLRNWCKDAIRFHTYTANLSVLGFSNRDPNPLGLVATWLILPVVICLS